MPEHRLHKILWASLVAGILTVCAAYVISVRAPRLPVIGQVHPFSLTNQLGRTVGLDALSGDVWVANVVFSRCPTQCRKLSRQMQVIQSRLPSGVRLVTLTADPQFDTPEVLKRYGEQYQADPAKWWFLTGPKAELYRLAIGDLKFSVVESGEPDAKLEDLFIHSASFVIVDRQGRLRVSVQSEDPDAEEKVLGYVRNLRLLR